MNKSLGKDLVNRKFTIPVVPRTKKNSQQVFVRNGRIINIPSKLYQQFEKEGLKVIHEKYRKKIDYPVNIKAVFYVETRRRIDLTNLLEALDDMLVKAEVILDDNRDIVASHNGSVVYWDKENPRIEVEITEVKNYERWKANEKSKIKTNSRISRRNIKK